jgi:hypothetical protein
VPNIDPLSVNQSSNILLELAGVLRAGRPEPSLTGRAGRPFVHPDVAVKMREFTEVADLQHEGVVALLVALSMRLKETAAAYVAVDRAGRQMIDGFLAGATYRSPR